MEPKNAKEHVIGFVDRQQLESDDSPVLAKLHYEWINGKNHIWLERQNQDDQRSHRGDDTDGLCDGSVCEAPNGGDLGHLED